MNKKDASQFWTLQKNRKAYIPYDIWLLTNYQSLANCLVGHGEKKGDEQNNMAEPIRLGLILEGEDAREFEERMNNPKVSEEQVAFFREAIRVYNTHKF